MGNSVNLNPANDKASLGKIIGNIFHTFAELCEKAANAEADKTEEEINKPAYFTARFFQLLFETTAYIANHILDWISNPVSLVSDFNSILQFFFDLGKMFANWVDELSGKKSITAHHEEIEEVKTSKTDAINPLIDNRISSTAMLLNNSFGAYTKPKDEIVMTTVPDTTINKQVINQIPDISKLETIAATSTPKLGR